MDTILNPDEYTEVEGRAYLNPQVALDRQNAFIQNLRDTQAQQNQQIAQDTYNLGSALPSAQGGLGTNTANNMGYFTSRLQTPQTSSAVANLRAAAQATALNQALQNEQEIWKKRYQDAYRAYQKRMNDKVNMPTPEDTTTEGGVETVDNTTDFVIDGSMPGVDDYFTVANIVPDWDNPENSLYTGITGVPFGEEYKTNYVYEFPSKYTITTGANGMGVSGGGFKNIGGGSGR